MGCCPQVSQAALGKTGPSAFCSLLSQLSCSSSAPLSQSQGCAEFQEPWYAKMCPGLTWELVHGGKRLHLEVSQNPTELAVNRVALHCLSGLILIAVVWDAQLKMRSISDLTLCPPATGISLAQSAGAKHVATGCKHVLCFPHTASHVGSLGGYKAFPPRVLHPLSLQVPLQGCGPWEVGQESNQNVFLEDT